MRELLEFSTMTDEEVKAVLKKNKIGLTVEEARKIETILGRAPTLTEAVMWGIQGSEHSSYKSSRKYLKTLPTEGPGVILGPVEDAGVVEIARDGNVRWGLVMSHESHNHPSQVVPFEGAATGIGGNVRDVACMGARVIGNLDPLRFGDPKNNECRVIAGEVVRGIAAYGNAIGVPNLGGDIRFDAAFNSNCLVNVLTVGLVREDEIIHSYVPKKAAQQEYDLIVVGKPTDSSGMGGAAFASLELDEKDKEANKGAVQEPNPFLKRHLLASTYDLFKKLKQRGRLHDVGFKDMGAGGIMCSTVEIADKSGFGATIDLENVNVALPGLHPSVIACAETQERFTWACPRDLTPVILKHYNETWELGSVAERAAAVVVGKVTSDGRYVLRYQGEVICDARATDITEGLRYDRPVKPIVKKLSEPAINEASLDWQKTMLNLLGSPNICSRQPVFQKYDKDVQGNSALEGGEADAGLITPLLDNPEVSPEVRNVGVAVKVDGNSAHSKISPYWQAANAVVECVRNVAAVGASAVAATDCLNYNNPEVPEFMWEFTEGVRGIAEACRAFNVPVISGNVSLYNSIDATAIIGVAGVMPDYRKAVTPQLKKAGNALYLVGQRKDELGAGEFYALLGHVGANVPQADFKEAHKEITFAIMAIQNGLAVACHDISEGGLLITLAEMTMPNHRTGGGVLGLSADLSEAGPREMPAYKKAFSETGGFVIEVSAEKEKELMALAKKAGLKPVRLGQVEATAIFRITHQGKTLVELKLPAMQNVWQNRLRELLS